MYSGSGLYMPEYQHMEGLSALRTSVRGIGLDPRDHCDISTRERLVRTQGREN